MTSPLEIYSYCTKVGSSCNSTVRICTHKIAKCLLLKTTTITTTIILFFFNNKRWKQESNPSSNKMCVVLLSFLLQQRSSWWHIRCQSHYGHGKHKPFQHYLLCYCKNSVSRNATKMIMITYLLWIPQVTARTCAMTLLNQHRRECY